MKIFIYIMVRKASAPPVESLYPNLTTVNDSSTESDQNFRLKEICEIRDYLEKEAESRGRLRRRYKAFCNTAYYVGMGSGLTSATSSTASVISLSTGIGALPAIALGIVAMTTGVDSVVSWKISELVLKKVEKH